MFREESPPVARLALQGPEKFVQPVRLSLAFDLESPALRRTDQIQQAEKQLTTEAQRTQRNTQNEESVKTLNKGVHS